MTSHTTTGWAVWVGACFLIWTFAFLIAEVYGSSFTTCFGLFTVRIDRIPFFNDLLGVISSLFASWFTYGISGVFWLHLHPRSERWTTPWMRVKTVFWYSIVLVRRPSCSLIFKPLLILYQSKIDGSLHHDCRNVRQYRQYR